MKQDGIDLKSEATVAYGAPPLLAAKTLDGEMDATLNFWNFCAALEAKGFRRLAGIEEILPRLGAQGAHRDDRLCLRRGLGRAPTATRVARFIAMTRKAKQMLVTSDADWEKIAPLTGATDAATLRRSTATAIAKAFRAGPSPRRKPTRACSIACWPRSAAATWSVRRPSSIPARSITPFPETEVLRLLSPFSVPCDLVDRRAVRRRDAKLPAPPAVLEGDHGGSTIGALFLQSRRDAGARRAGLRAGDVGRRAIGYLMGRVRARRPARRSLADPAAEPAGAGRDRARLYLGRARPRSPRSRRLPSTSCRPPSSRCAKARARSTARWTRWRPCSRCRAGAPSATWCCRSLRPISPPPRARACRWCGRSCWWPNCWDGRTASASRSASPSSCSTSPRLLAYSLTFAAVVLVIETALVQPFEMRATRWRPRAA